MRLRRHFRLFVRGSFRLEVVREVISDANEGQVGMNVAVEFGDSGANRSRYIRLSHFVMNDDNDDAGRRTTSDLSLMQIAFSAADCFCRSTT